MKIAIIEKIERALFSFLPSLPTTRTGLCGGERLKNIISAPIFRLGVWSENSSLMVVLWFLIALTLTGFAVFTLSFSYASKACEHKLYTYRTCVLSWYKVLTHFLLIIDKPVSVKLPLSYLL